MKKIKLGVLIYTYNHVEDAKISMDIIKNIWQKSKIFSSIKIVHAYNGEKKWYAKKYKEDSLVRIKNSGHFQGASELIDVGIKELKERYSDIDYVFILASDTWLVKLEYIEKIIKKMIEGKLYLSTCSWGLPDRNNIFDVGMAVDLFVVDFSWALKFKMFPICYKKFKDKFGELFLYMKGGNVMLEKLTFSRFLQAIFKEYNDNNQLRYQVLGKMNILKDREPVHSHINDVGFWIRKEYWPKMGLLTHHDLKRKKRILKKLNPDFIF